MRKIGDQKLCGREGYCSILLAGGRWVPGTARDGEPVREWEGETRGL